jgi:hypothetical protein
MRWYVGRLVDWVKQHETITLRAVLENAIREAPSKAMLIGTFCALLELMKLGVVVAHQAGPLAEVTIALKPEHRADIDEIVRTSGFEDETPAAPVASEAPPDQTGPEEGGRPAPPAPDSPPPTYDPDGDN